MLDILLQYGYCVDFNFNDSFRRNYWRKLFEIKTAAAAADKFIQTFYNILYISMIYLLPENVDTSAFISNVGELFALVEYFGYEYPTLRINIFTNHMVQQIYYLLGFEKTMCLRVQYYALGKTRLSFYLYLPVQLFFTSRV